MPSVMCVRGEGAELPPVVDGLLSDLSSILLRGRAEIDQSTPAANASIRLPYDSALLEAEVLRIRDTEDGRQVVGVVRDLSVVPKVGGAVIELWLWCPDVAGDEVGDESGS